MRFVVERALFAWNDSLSRVLAGVVAASVSALL